MNDPIDAHGGTDAFEQIQMLRDPGIGLYGFLAIHDTRLGPAFGGIRLFDYATPSDALADAMRLAEHMTYKCAIQEVPGGGGKVVLMRQPDMDRGAVFRRLGEYVEQLGGRYYTGPDVGTGPDDLLAVAEKTNYVARPDLEGARSLGDATARGVLAGIRATARRLGFDSLEGVHVAVAGLGDVGTRLVDLLAGAGAELTVADLIDERVEAKVLNVGARSAPPDELHEVRCDIYAPCALGGAINGRTLGELSCRAVAGSANNVLATPADGLALHERGILYAPDFVINSGGLVQGALFHLDGVSPPPERVERIESILDGIFAAAAASDTPPEVVADAQARAKFAAAPEGVFVPGQS